MNSARLIFKEILHRKANFLLSLLAVVTAVALFVSFFTTGEASKAETRRLMRDIGYNLRIVPKGTDMNRFWPAGYSDLTMPEEYARRFVEADNISYNHLTATLQGRIEWGGSEAVFLGIAPEISPPGKAKPGMIYNDPKVYSMKPGTVALGYHLHHETGARKGDEIQIQGKPFTVSALLAETGTEDDIRVVGTLADAQTLLGLEGRINEIKALDCLCLLEGQEPLEVLRAELADILPEGHLFHIKPVAEARDRQRKMSEEYFALAMPIVVVVCAVWIGALAMLNTRERRNEIGVLRALGYGSGKVASLFLGKAVLTGLVGAGIGFGVGTWLALAFGPDIFEVTAKNIRPIHVLLVWSSIAAPAFAALSSFIPAMVAVTQDPAETLRQE